MRLALYSLAFSSALMASSSGLSALSIDAEEAYYTFGSGVSANTTRLLSDRATVIGFPGLETISFILFDVAKLPKELLKPSGQRAYLKLEHDPDEHADGLIAAEDSRPVSVSIYGIGGAWDPVNGNLLDIEYGVSGADAIATTLVGDPGIYEWDITSLVNDWISGAQSTTALSLSGVFGNVDQDGFNSYAAFHTLGSNSGLSPVLHIAPIPLPASLWLMLTGLLTLSRRIRLQRAFSLLQRTEA